MLCVWSSIDPTSLWDSSFFFLQMNFETENPHFSKDRQLIMVQSEDFISDLTSKLMLYWLQKEPKFTDKLFYYSQLLH